ncbi:hypothetical protein GCM10029992_58960 [Glycomyces albus]
MSEDPNDLSSPIDEGVTAEDLGRTLFIGVGGVGMNGLTRLYATRGLPVSGSELKDWPSLPELERLGVTLHREHTESNLDGIDTVVRSTAHNDDHLEVAEARRRGIRVYHRSEALAAAMTGRQSIVVTGTHGKTTTTAIIVQMLQHPGLDPSYVNGGENIGAHTGAHGTGEHFVAEADESDRSFLRYRPEIGVITNIDLDHLNNYGDMDALTAAFERFGRNTSKDGLLVLCADNSGTAALAAKFRSEGRTVATYGFTDGADIQVGEVESHKDGVDYTVLLHGERLGRFHLPMPGAHIALNSAAAIAVGLHLGLDPETLTGDWPPSAASSADLRSEVRGAGSTAFTPCTTSTPTTRPRCGRPSRPSRRSRPPEGSWWCSCPTGSTGPSRCGPRSPRRCPWPTGSWSWRSSAPARRSPKERADGP